MWYIKPEPNPSGAYGAPQSNKFQGAISMTDEQMQSLISYNGFVELTVEDEAVVEVTPKTEAWEEWKASLPEETDPETVPTQLDIIEAQVTYTAMMTDTLLEV